MIRTFLCLLLLLPIANAAPAKPAPAKSPVTAAPVDRTLSIIRVNVTNQGWDFARPWGKRAPYSRRAIGTVLPGGRVLVTAELVANANYVELETAGGGQKVPATVEVVDYECNLALLKPEDDTFLKGKPGLELTSARVGDELGILQLENNGNLLVTKGPMTSADIGRYPIDDSPFLIYKLTAQLQMRDSSFTLPVLKGDKLAGILQRYDNTSNNADLIPTPVIEHFLKDAAKAPYEGFPRAGMAISGTRDPQLRRYLGLKEGTGGVYVTDVLRDGPAARGGLEKDDVIFKIDANALDQDGNYSDPDYGKIAVTHLLGTRHFDGDVVKFTVQRKGEVKELAITLAHRPVESFVIEPYIIDRAPRFYILGGLILQELSRQYLKEWGADWQKKAPENFVYYDRQQAELFKDGPKKIVFLSRVMPTPATVGYEELNHLVVKRINGLELQTLDDVATALAKPADGFHKIEFNEDPKVIYLDAEQAEKTGQLVQRQYGLPTLKRLE